LFELLKNTEAKFILSTWHHNKYRKNKYIDLLWNNFNINILEHFYHIGASEENRNSMQEAIVTNFAENEEDYMQFSFPSKGYQQ
jgi:DNA adenine methylase